MNLINLSVEEMVFVSSAWTQPGEVRDLIMKTPEVSGLMPRIERVHTALLKFQPKADPRLGELSEAAAEADGVHDNLIRGIHTILTGLSLLESARGEDYLSLRDELLPEGLGHGQKNYQSEAGYTSLVKERLSPETRQQLASTTINGKPLADYVQAWLDAGTKLGAIEAERASRINPTPPTRAQVHSARLDWLRIANAFAGGIDISDLNDAHRKQVVGPLEQASVSSERRGARRRPAPLQSTVVPADPAAAKAAEGSERSA